MMQAKSLPEPFAEWPGVVLYHGDCRDIAGALGLFDSVITDPPYHLTSGKRGGTGAASDNPNSPAGRSRIGTGFMGKSWDGGDVAFRPETWSTIAEACKPGAMLLSFGGTRTFHRLACAIEDAGLEIRDCLSWLYGSGFPKSLDISKAIDKAAGVQFETRGHFQYTQADEAATPGAFRTNEERQNPGCRRADPTTDAAQVWNGWGTALKPAWEPVILAMKALDGTFAENAQAHGVAGLNIDGSRIEHASEADRQSATPQGKCTAKVGALAGGTERDGERTEFVPRGREGEASSQNRYTENGGTDFAATPGPRGGDPMGRFPANLLLDEEAAALLDEQSGFLTSGNLNGETVNADNQIYGSAGSTLNRQLMVRSGDSGGASRFFYTAKASRSERGKTNKHPTVKPLDLMRYLCRLTSTPTGGRVLDPFAGSGSTLIAAWLEGRPCVGIELDREHCRMAADRINKIMKQPRLPFDDRTASVVEPPKETQAEMFA